MDTLKYWEEYYKQEEFKKYGVSKMRTYNDTIMKIYLQQQLDEYAKYGATIYEEYQDTLRKLNIEKQRVEFENIEQKLVNGEGTSADIKYYVARVNTMGWINWDAFSSFPNKTKINMVTDVQYNSGYDCKLVFRDRKSAMRAASFARKCGFGTIPKGIDVWLVSLKYMQGQAYISLHETTTQEKTPKANFRAVSIEELKQELLKVDNL